MSWDNSNWLLIMVAMICFTVLSLPVIINATRLFHSREEEEHSKKQDTTITYKVGDTEHTITISDGDDNK